MHKVLVSVLFLTMISTPLLSQKKWKDIYYEELTDETFRDFKGFKKELNPKKVDYKLLNAAVFFVTNEARLEYGLKAVSYNTNLEIMAWNHSIQMGKKDFFEHINPKTEERATATDRAKLAGIKNPAIGENISAIGGEQFGNYLDLAERLVDGWIDSPPHRKTLYSPDAVQLGCGIYYYGGVWQKNKGIRKQGNGFWLATQNFQLFTNVKAGSSKDKGPN